MNKRPSRATNGQKQPLVHSEKHCAAYVRIRFKEFLGRAKAETVLRYLLGHGWTYCEIYQLTRHNQMIYDETRKMLALHEYLCASGIDSPLVKRVLCSRILPQTANPTDLVKTIKHLIACGLSQQRLCELVNKKPRILMLTPAQIDACRRSSMANNTSFTYYLRKATTASVQCPNRRPAMHVAAKSSVRQKATSPSPAISP